MNGGPVGSTGLWRRHGPIALVLAAFVVLGLLYSQSTPLLEAPDEMWHYPYVKHIADGKGLPRLSQEGEKSEFFQPPLYYALMALVTAPIATDDLSELTTPNPYWGYEARAATADNKTILVHTEREEWPYRGAVLAIRLARWLSVLLSALTVWGAYLLGLEIWPERRYMAWGAAALVAFTPQFLYLSGSVNNDNLIAPLCTLVVWLLAGLLRGKASSKRLVALGALMGLALLTKWTALALLPLAGLALGYRAWRSRSWAQLLHEGALVFGLAALLSGWSFVRNQVLYTDPLGLGAKWEIFPPRSPRPTWLDLIREIPRKEISFWACFGWENVYIADWMYGVLRAFVYVGLLGLAAQVWRAWRRREAAPWAHWALLAAWVAAVAAAFVRWMIYTEAAVGRHLFPAIACIMLLLLWGWTWRLPRRQAAWLAAAFGGALFLLAAVTPFRYIRPIYAPPPRYSEASLPPIAHSLDAELGGKARLIGYELPEGPVAPGSKMTITLYWQVLERFEENYSVFLHVVGPDGRLAAQRDSYPGLGNYATVRWKPGEIIADSYPVPVPADAPARLRVLTGMYLLSTMQRLPVTGEAVHEQGAIELGWVDVRPAAP